MNETKYILYCMTPNALLYIALEDFLLLEDCLKAKNLPGKKSSGRLWPLYVVYVISIHFINYVQQTHIALFRGLTEAIPNSNNLKFIFVLFLLFV